ncbi:hypothetical protein PILCRDRAFT_128171 [Piloderma croceum F 1598]|uniref:Uncharacterized protein n=1 Tax=Piloderma croceum (strain F 1598) TaxID=765440 RepID=A0A0C3CNR7_PILCF|nr:hypothetical protein PILCRDRAFT_128171 [Piloderma croceum F 1598]
MRGKKYRKMDRDSLHKVKELGTRASTQARNISPDHTPQKALFRNLEEDYVLGPGDHNDKFPFDDMFEPDPPTSFFSSTWTDEHGEVFYYRIHQRNSESGPFSRVRWIGYKVRIVQYVHYHFRFQESDNASSNDTDPEAPGTISSKMDLNGPTYN